MYLIPSSAIVFLPLDSLERNLGLELKKNPFRRRYLDRVGQATLAGRLKKQDELPRVRAVPTYPFCAGTE